MESYSVIMDQVEIIQFSFTPKRLTLIAPCGVNLTPENDFHLLLKNHQHHSSEIL